MEEFKLPPHIIKVSDKWYQNVETDKYIHPDHIQDICERYWVGIANRIAAGNAKVKYKKNFKSSKRRWEDEH